jgi:hypothetical protein
VTCVHIYIYTKKAPFERQTVNYSKSTNIGQLVKGVVLWSLKKRRDYSDGVDIAPAEW